MLLPVAIFEIVEIQLIQISMKGAPEYKEFYSSFFPPPQQVTSAEELFSPSEHCPSKNDLEQNEVIRNVLRDSKFTLSLIRYGSFLPQTDPALMVRELHPGTMLQDNIHQRLAVSINTLNENAAHFQIEEGKIQANIGGGARGADSLNFAAANLQRHSVHPSSKRNQLVALPGTAMLHQMLEEAVALEEAAMLDHRRSQPVSPLETYFVMYAKERGLLDPMDQRRLFSSFVHKLRNQHHGRLPARSEDGADLLMLPGPEQMAAKERSVVSRALTWMGEGVKRFVQGPSVSTGVEHRAVEGADHREYADFQFVSPTIKRGRISQSAGGREPAYGEPRRRIPLLDWSEGLRNLGPHNDTAWTTRWGRTHIFFRKGLLGRTTYHVSYTHFIQNPRFSTRPGYVNIPPVVGYPRW